MLKTCYLLYSLLSKGKGGIYQDSAMLRHHNIATEMTDSHSGNLQYVSEVMAPELFYGIII